MRTYNFSCLRDFLAFWDRLSLGFFSFSLVVGSTVCCRVVSPSSQFVEDEREQVDKVERFVGKGEGFSVWAFLDWISPGFFSFSLVVGSTVCCRLVSFRFAFHISQVPDFQIECNLVFFNGKVRTNISFFDYFI